MQAFACSVQETRLQTKACSDMQLKLGLQGWKHYWVCSEERKGNAGVAVFSRWGAQLPDICFQGLVCPAPSAGASVSWGGADAVVEAPGAVAGSFEAPVDRVESGASAIGAG